MTAIEWTNPSVKKLAGTTDPTVAILNWTRKIIFDAMDNGWMGPPYDVFLLAQHLGISVVPREDVLDARLVSDKNGTQIHYNPNRSLSRIRFSVAHEIAHTLFPDFSESIQNRSRINERSDYWQLELLCNIAAAEILMPAGPNGFDPNTIAVSIDHAINVRNMFAVSIEAALLRLGKSTKQPVSIFAAARVSDNRGSDFRIDYVVNSPSSGVNLKPGMKIPSSSVLSECSAIGFTAKKRERWGDDMPEFDIECIGVASYPKNIYPRVLGILKTKKSVDLEPPAIQYLVGDATEPRGNDPRIIAQIVNDKSKNWGAGFGREVSRKWPQVTKNFRKWATKDGNLSLGNSCLYNISDNLYIFHMVAQHGYGFSSIPRIRYGPLSNCLDSLRLECEKLSATVHMPRIGTGYAGGKWSIVSELIEEKLIKHGISVTVYDLSKMRLKPPKKTLSRINNFRNNW